MLKHNFSQGPCDIQAISCPKYSEGHFLPSCLASPQFTLILKDVKPTPARIHNENVATRQGVDYTLGKSLTSFKHSKKGTVILKLLQTEFTFMQLKYNFGFIPLCCKILLRVCCIL